VRLVIAESAIDALSYAALFPDTQARYASIGGEMNPRQPELIKAAIGKMPEGSEIVAAFDADAQGRAFAEALHRLMREFSESTGRNDLSFRADLPEVEGQDWNEVFESPRPFFPYCPSWAVNCKGLSLPRGSLLVAVWERGRRGEGVSPFPFLVRD
jgi:Toprim-like